MSNMCGMMEGKEEKCFRGKEKKSTRTQCFGRTYVCDQRERKVRVL